MKKALSVFSLAFLVILSANAQLSKKEQKEWKKKLKSVSPQQYKDLLDQNKQYKNQVSAMKNELSGVDSKIADRDNQISQYQEQVSTLRSELAATKRKLSAKPSTPAPKKTALRGAEPVNMDGVVFKVQIGAFKNKDLSKYLNNHKNFSGEVGDDGMMRYTLGIFRDYWEADTFKKYLREMGVKDAWIVSFADGKRVPIKDVLEGVMNKG